VERSQLTFRLFFPNTGTSTVRVPGYKPDQCIFVVDLVRWPGTGRCGGLAGVWMISSTGHSTVTLSAHAQK